MSKINPSQFICNDQVPYQWRQSLSEVEIVLSLPEGTRAKNLQVHFSARSLRVVLCSSSSSVGREACNTILLEGEFPRPIVPDACTWTLEEGNLCLLMGKANPGTEWWSCALKGAPEIDTSQIEPEPSSLADLDPATRATVERMMLEQRAKRQ